MVVIGDRGGALYQSNCVDCVVLEEEAAEAVRPNIYSAVRSTKKSKEDS